eukprot:5737493-Prymnesium_polylepis.1
MSSNGLARTLAPAFSHQQRGTLAAYGVQKTIVTIEKQAGQPLGCTLQQVGRPVFVESISSDSGTAHWDGTPGRAGAPEDLGRVIPAGTVLLRVNREPAARNMKRASAVIAAASTVRLEVLTHNPHSRDVRLAPSSEGAHGLTLTSAGPYLRILRIDEGSRAERIGLQPHDILLAIDGIMATSARTALRALRGPGAVSLRLLPRGSFDPGADWTAFSRLVSSSDRALELLDEWHPLRDPAATASAMRHFRNADPFGRPDPLEADGMLGGRQVALEIMEAARARAVSPHRLSFGDGGDEDDGGYDGEYDASAVRPFGQHVQSQHVQSPERRGARDVLSPYAGGVGSGGSSGGLARSPSRMHLRSSLAPRPFRTPPVGDGRAGGDCENAPANQWAVQRDEAKPTAASRSAELHSPLSSRARRSDEVVWLQPRDLDSPSDHEGEGGLSVEEL